MENTENRGGSEMASSNSKQRNPSRFMKILNSMIGYLSIFTITHILFLRSLPAPFYAFIAVSAISVISSLLDYYSGPNPLCFASYIALFLASSLGQLLSVLALFAWEKQLILMLKSKTDPMEAKIELRVLCGIMMLILVLHLLVLAAICSERRRARDSSVSEATEA